MNMHQMDPYFFLSILPFCWHFCVCVVLSAVGVEQELSERIQVAVLLAVLSVTALLAVFFFSS